MIYRGHELRGETFANGSLGFSNGSPSLDRHPWDVRCGYVAGPEMVRLGSGLVCMVAWLSTLDIGVVVPAFRIGSVLESAEGAFQDGNTLKSIVEDVLSGVLSEGSLRTRFPQFGAVLFAMILTDRALLWRS